ncbi:integrase family protein [Halorubrum californiense DSM 19288]|uniref:Integrase family protein n=2 Tax=Haloferacaceae TaxID=1644056 RepID=M0E588_9EURY|nr:integrase family protein [Halorubrum californiense DSM 19288]
MGPREARDDYLRERKEDASFETLRTIRKGVNLFVEWCEEKDIHNLNEIGGRQLNKFKNWCKETSDNNTVSLNGILGILRRFLVYCVRIEAVASGTPDKTPIPNVPEDEEVSDEKPTDEEVEATLEYLETYERASRRHVEYRLMEEIGCRVGAIRAIDIKDVDLEERAIRFRHRPENDHPDEKGTPLKNQTDGQRHGNIPTDLAELIGDYLDNPDRHDVTDRFGRKPLLTTRHGRPSTDTIRRDLYKVTRPCVHANNCPHDRDIDSCDAVKNAYASECPSSHSPHPLRRYSIESQIDAGVPKDRLTSRVDVSIPVLNRHYDTRSEERKRKHRLKIFEKLFDGYGDPEETLDMDHVPDNLFNEDEMIDPQVLSRLQSNDADSATGPASDGARGSEGTETVDTGDKSDETPEETDVVQRSIDEVWRGPTAVFGPGTAAASATAALGSRTAGRLHNELEAMTPGESGVTPPSAERAAKGVAGYALFVAMLAVNFALLGIVPA